MTKIFIESKFKLKQTFPLQAIQELVNPLIIDSLTITDDGVIAIIQQDIDINVANTVTSALKQYVLDNLFKATIID